MERSGRHKGNSERALLTARAKVSNVLESEELSTSARAALEEVVSFIRSVELHVGQKRLGEFRMKPSLDFLASPDAHMEGSLQLHREALLQLYTDCDLVAAEGNSAISPLERKDGQLAAGLVSKRERRMSTQELDASVAYLLSSRGKATSMLEQVGTLGFDALAFSEIVPQHTLFVLFASLEDRLRLIKQLRDLGQVGDAANFHGKLIQFMEKINSLYEDANPYHNSSHAADVVSTLEWFFRSEYLQSRTTPLDHLISLIGGAIHDVGHPGQNNLFHAKTMSAWAIRYNDKSILENMHVSLSFELMQREVATDWFRLLPVDYRAQTEGQAEETAPAVNLQHFVRKALVQMILATDQGKHAQGVQDLKIFVEEQSKGTSAKGDENQQKQLALENKLLTLDTILHAADISNPARPRPIMLKWTKRVLSEFWAQGDEESRLGLPISPLCEKETESQAVPKGQLGFINFVVHPLFVQLKILIPEVQESLDLLQSNIEFWEEQNEAKATHAQLFEGV